MPGFLYSSLEVLYCNLQWLIHSYFKIFGKPVFLAHIPTAFFIPVFALPTSNIFSRT